MSSDNKNISSIIEDISNRFNSLDKDNSLIELRDSNLKLYYNLDISFLSDVDAKYNRSKSGGGAWDVKKVPSAWQIKYKDLVFNLKLMSFKHTGC